MKCFNEKKWIDFLNGNVSCKENDEMIEHLSECEECLKTYSNCAEKNIINTHDNYEAQVLMKLRSKNKTEFNKRLIKYVIAASITIFFYSAGVFDHMLTIPYKFSSEIVALNSSINKINLNINDIWRSIYNEKK